MPTTRSSSQADISAKEAARRAEEVLVALRRTATFLPPEKVSAQAPSPLAAVIPGAVLGATKAWDGVRALYATSGVLFNTLLACIAFVVSLNPQWWSSVVVAVTACLLAVYAVNRVFRACSEVNSLGALFAEIITVLVCVLIAVVVLYFTGHAARTTQISTLQMRRVAICEKAAQSDESNEVGMNYTQCIKFYPMIRAAEHITNSSISMVDKCRQWNPFVTSSDCEATALCVHVDNATCVPAFDLFIDKRESMRDAVLVTRQLSDALAAPVGYGDCIRLGYDTLVSQPLAAIVLFFEERRLVHGCILVYCLACILYRCLAPLHKSDTTPARRHLVELVAMRWPILSLVIAMFAAEAIGFMYASLPMIRGALKPYTEWIYTLAGGCGILSYLGTHPEVVSMIIKYTRECCHRVSDATRNTPTRDGKSPTPVDDVE